METFGTLDDLLHWPILAQLGLHRLQTITRAHVQPDGELAYIVDRDDRVYAVTETADSFLVSELSGQKIRAFVMRGPKFALSDGGRLYGWGSNSSNQLGMEGASRTVDSPTKITRLGDRHIIRIACGNEHTLALTSEGEVWGWGRDINGCLGEQQPWKIPKCRDIAAGFGTSVALTEDGIVYTSGSNDHGQLGYNPKGEGPHKVSIDRPVVKVSMGNHHVLALTEDGRLFAWGRNHQGQLGNERKDTSATSPVAINIEDGNPQAKRIADISAIADTSIAVRTDGVVYLWGKCGGQYQDFPEANHHTNMVVLLAKYGLGSEKTIVIQNANFMRDTGHAFDNISLSDCHFSVEGKKIHAQKHLLKARSSYFQSMFDGKWNESDGEITITEHSYSVYKSLLRYLSTGRLAVADNDLILLTQLAHETMNDNLTNICAEKLRYKLSVENIIDVFTMAKTLELNFLLNYCKQFTIIYMKDILEAELSKRPELATQLLTFATAKEDKKDIVEKTDMDSKDNVDS